MAASSRKVGAIGVVGTDGPRSLHLVDHVVLDLEQDVDGNIGDRLGTVECEGVTAEPARQRQLVVLVLALVLVLVVAVPGAIVEP